MDNRKIFIMNLAKGRIGEDNSKLIGGMLITKIYLAAMSRADLPNRVMATMPNFYLYVDEFQSFANESFADILSEARKYHLNLTIAHQYIEQMEEEVRAAVFGNVGTMIIFRVGAYDAEVLEKEFAPTFTAEDIVNLGQYQIYLKLMIDGISSQPFSATNLPPIKPPEVDHVADVIASSREQFAHKRVDVESAISDWHKPIMKAPPQSYNPNSAASNPVSPASVPSIKPVSATVTSTSSAPTSPPPRQAQAIVQPMHQEVHRVSQAPQQIRQQSPASVAPTSPPQQTLHSQPHSQPHSSPSHIQHPSERATEKPAPNRISVPQKPPVVQPFKEAFQNAAVPVSVSADVPVSSAPVSLNTLAKPFVKNDQKTPTAKNVNDLKNALASVLGAAHGGAVKAHPQEKSEVKPVEKIAEKSAEKILEKPVEQAKPTVKPDITLPAKEVPKDVLEQILKVN